MIRVMLLVSVAAISACAPPVKEVPVTQSDLIGQWSMDSAFDPSDWTRLELRSDGSAEIVLYQKLPQSLGSKNIETGIKLSGRYRLEKDTLLVQFNDRGSMEASIASKTYTASGSLANTSKDPEIIGTRLKKVGEEIQYEIVNRKTGKIATRVLRHWKSSSSDAK